MIRKKTPNGDIEIKAPRTRLTVVIHPSYIDMIELIIGGGVVTISRKELVALQELLHAAYNEIAILEQK